LQLSVIIVNYNVRHFLEQCLYSVLKACRNIETEVIVIDNQSSDDSQNFFKNRFKKVQFVWKTENGGFAKANNQGWRIACGKYVLFLNPDTILAEDSIMRCINFMEATPDAGAIGVQMIDGSGAWLPESKRGYPSAWAAICKFIGLARLFPQSATFARYYLGHLNKQGNHQVAILSGACMMVKRTVLEKTGGFDEDFFMYAEDIDLSCRIQNAGYKNYYFAETVILHFKGESTVKESPSYILRFYGTMIQFVQKHYNGIPRVLYVMLLRCLIAVKLLFTKSERKENNEITQACCYVWGMPDNDPHLRTLLGKHFTNWIPVKSIHEVPAGAPLLLCEPALSFHDIISIMAEHTGKCQFFIHAEGAAAITGSPRSGERGLALI